MEYISSTTKELGIRARARCTKPPKIKFLHMKYYLPVNQIMLGLSFKSAAVVPVSKLAGLGFHGNSWITEHV